MRAAPIAVVSTGACLLLAAACNALVGNSDHELAADGAADVNLDSGGSGSGSGPRSRAADSEAAADHAHATTPDGDADAGIVDAAPFCPTFDAGPLVYCMDFDGVDAAALGIFSDNQADATIVTGVYVSPQNSLVMNLPAEGDGVVGYAVPFVDFSPTTARLEFEIRSVPLSDMVETLQLRFSDSTDTRTGTLAVDLSPDGYSIEESVQVWDGGASTDYVHPAVAPVGDASVGAWHHVVLTAALDDMTCQYTSGLTVDGQVLEANFPLQLDWAQGVPTVVVYAEYSNWHNAGPMRIFVDNVRADFGL